MEFFSLLLLLCFSSPEQCPSAAGSHNSPPAHLRPSSRPRYLLFLIWPGPASTAASHCLSEGSTRGAGASPNTLIFVSGSAPAFLREEIKKKKKTSAFQNVGRRRSLVDPGGVRVRTHFLRARAGQKQNPHPSGAPPGPAGVCVCHRPLSGRRAGACSPDEPPLAEEVLLRIGLFVAR